MRPLAKVAAESGDFGRAIELIQKAARVAALKDAQSESVA
jgi:hypothetical protein